jgi:alpha-L-rhamnosidase
MFREEKSRGRYQMIAIHLRTNDRINPLGIDDDTITFRWNCQDGLDQTAFQIILWDEEKRQVHDSDKIRSSQMHYQLPDAIVRGKIRYYWQITLWDENQKADQSETAFFETGLMQESWKAKWITTGVKAGKERIPADYFQRKFHINGNIKKARLYATACGVYSVDVNGKRLPGVLTPGTCEYTKRLFYQTYDLKEFLAEQNTITFILGDGWYMGKLGFLNVTNRFGNMRKLLAQIEVILEDGSQLIFGSDDSFSCCNDGPIRYADLKDGEIYDARMVPGFSHKALITKHSIIPMASLQDSIAEHEEFTPRLLKSPKGADILDFGQNMAGYIRFDLKGTKGQQIKIRMFEALDHGEYSDATIGQPDPKLPDILQEITYICKGGREIFYPEFFYSGFRYALVTGLNEVKPENFTAIAVYSNLQFESTFRCSNEKINQFYENTVWSLRSNFVDAPTDCPQREKSGWDGDAQVFLPTACYITDVAAFFRKWLKDMRDCQRKDGRVANVSPSAHRHQDQDIANGAVGWADAAVMIPYYLWKLYGDKQFIEDNYELMHGWKKYVIAACQDKRMKRLDHIVRFFTKKESHFVPKSRHAFYVIESGRNWGEWCEPDIDSLSELSQPKPEIATAYTYHSMTILEEMLEAIGKKEEAKECKEFARGAREAYHYYFVENGTIKAPRQSPLVRSLALGLLEEKDAKVIAEKLNQSAIERNYTVGTGFLSTPYVLPMLVKYGYIETAYRMLENTTAPGWLAMVEAGATTVWETYEIYDKEGHPLQHSMNHYSPGAVCSFLYDTVCGIQVKEENTFRICPIPGGSLTEAYAEYASPYGKVISEWKKNENEIVFHFEIPANTKAYVELPNGTSEVFITGSYERKVISC